MDPDSEIIGRIKNLRQGKKHGKNAINKPLLLLCALGRYWNGSNRMMHFSEIAKPLRHLFEIVGENRHREEALFPFVHMCNDGVWELTGKKSINEWVGKGSGRRPSLKDANESDLMGGIDEYTYKRIINDKVFLLKLVFEVLDKYFGNKEKSTWVELLYAIGIPDIPARDSFHCSVLKNYMFQCAVCDQMREKNEFNQNIRVAYIKSPEISGEERLREKIDNALALCSVHDELFKHGAFSIAEAKNIVVSDRIRNCNVNLSPYNGKPLNRPAKEHPNKKYTDWHYKEIFRG